MGRSIHFCRGPKSKIARHGTVLVLRSQVVVAGICVGKCPRKEGVDDARDALRRILRVDGPDVDDPAGPSQLGDVVRPARRDAAGSHDVRC